MTTKEKLNQIAEAEDMMEEFIIKFEEQMMSDDESSDKKFRQLKATYEQHPDIVDGIMMALCGYRMETIADFVLGA